MTDSENPDDCRAAEKGRRPHFRRYRIGDYARFMGVGPDFLKHYERNGILDAESRENGYRYFSFDQSARILEVMRLRGCGIPVREMGPMLFERTGAEIADVLSELGDTLEAKIRRDQAVLEEVRAEEAWLRERLVQPEDWEIRRSEGFYFLPHANGADFIQDERISAILPAWMEAMPLVKSALRFTPPACAFDPSADAPAPDTDEFSILKATWGFMVSESVREKLSLPVNDVVEYVPAGRRFVHHFGVPSALGVLATLADGTNGLYRAMRETNQRPAADGLCFMEVRMTARRRDVRESYGVFQVVLH